MSESDRSHKSIGVVPLRRGPSGGVVFEYLYLLVQLAALLGVGVLFEIELERGFFEVAVLTVVGFAIHYWLPPRLKIPFFVSLTALALTWLFGTDAIWILSLSVIFILLCHLPLPWTLRVLVLVAVGGMLGIVSKAKLLAPSWAQTVVPILAAMFMFRIILYMYDLKNERTEATPWQRISYFLMLPNICFPLFPVVDYKTYVRATRDGRSSDVYQKGIFWVARGLTHLLLYRLVYYSLPVIDRMEGVFGVYLFLAFTYALYLRVSGIFHLIAGILCMFGFDMPRTNNNYFLSSSFADLWRRINIYWKQFMMTTVFYPVMMGFRKFGMSTRVLLATATVFVVTWALHSYQWFWLVGEFPIALTDIVFWGFLGCALMVNAVMELRRGKSKGRRGEGGFGSRIRHMAKIIAMFSTMALLWTLWDMGSFVEWKYLLLRSGESNWKEWIAFGLAVLGLLLVGALAFGFAEREESHGIVRRRVARLAPAGITMAALCALVVGVPAVSRSMDGSSGKVVKVLKSSGPNDIELAEEERGYYEVLTRATGAERDPEREDFEGANLVSGMAVQPTQDLRGYELVPNVEIALKGAPFKVNSQGLHDREYTLEKAAGVTRIAVLGSSHVMGVGVPMEENFENLIEERLNVQTVSGNGRPYEVINFGVAGYGLLQIMSMSENVVPLFEPDIVLFVSHPGEEERLIDRLRTTIQSSPESVAHYKTLSELFETEDLNGELPHSEFSRRLRKHRTMLTQWVYYNVAQQIDRGGGRAVFVFMPTVDRRFNREELKRLRSYVESLGVETIALNNLYDGFENSELWVADDDHHPNRIGHKLIADRLLKELISAGVLRGSGAAKTATLSER